MKNKLWLIQLPVVLFFTLCFALTEAGIDGRLENTFLRESIFPGLRRVTAFATDMKFRFRGEEKPKNKIVVVEVDENALAEIGRWPWHRDQTARLIENTFKAGARVVGLDIVFSEPDRRVPAALGEVLASKGLDQVASSFETDPIMRKVIAKYSDRLVLGWVSESPCQPLYAPSEECPVTNPDAIATLPPGLKRFAFDQMNVQGPGFDPAKTPILSFPTMLANLPEYNEVASHIGSFNVGPDPDGTVRRINLVLMGAGQAYPALALEMARVGQNEKLEIALTASNRVDSMRFGKSGRKIHVSPQGVMDINFRGRKTNSFTYVSAVDVLADGDILKDELNRKLAGVSKREVLRDAFVFIGATAIGANDMRNFPFEQGVAGVDGHAQILDNLLSGDELRSQGEGWLTNGRFWLYALMVVAALGFAVAMQRLEAVPALLLSLASFAAFGAIDVKALFVNGYNWNTVFLYLEMATIFVLTIAVKYWVEEQDKKFIRSAFSKYVAPAVVDAIMKDPKSLMLGGVKKDLTILFSDIRGFTTMSEAMDAKALASFLNDYLGIMTEIVFKNSGTLDKYIGDAVMAFWGAPLDEPRHALKSCKAAVEMMQALETNKPRFKSQYGFDVDIGVGLNSGLVNVGNMGSVNNFEYTVIGDHVNLASRLEGLTKYYGASIITSRFTLDMIAASGPVDTAELPPYRTLDFVKVKGKKNAVELIHLMHLVYPAEALELYDAGRALYARRDWDGAMEKLKAASQLISTVTGAPDGPSELLIGRCADFKATPPEADWDGSWEMTSK